MSLESSRFPPLADQAESLGRAVLVVFLAFAGALVVTGLVGQALIETGLLVREELSGRVGLSVLQFVGFGIGVAAYLGFADDWRLIRAHLPGLRDLGAIGAGIFVILLSAAGVGQLLAALGVDVAQNQVIAVGQSNPEYFLYMIPVSLLFVGPFEELVFRGGVQGLLRRTYGPWIAVALATTLFGAMHTVALIGGSGSVLAYVAVAAVLGLVLGVAYELTENLVVPAVIHGAYNSVLFAVQYAVATGAVPA
ncbi:CPBP family intramembrane glutamic endopeptidase [Salinirubrum litoreum]|uniref:CPBP family intramembrane glutamic endopeptidase n=1 Tax=Salinirubrum litoreum TaxID=1126234 RepID=A0ABD5R5W3_9EURY|nr:CPBP family intramembrane glutamic endopeptidase [Salinirubrum litoreum]